MLWIAAHGVQLFFGAVILWVIGVFLLITFEPESGADSTEALQSAVRARVADQDAAGFARLFVAGTIGDDYPATLLTRLQKIGPDGWDTDVTTVGGHRELVLSGLPGCLSWALTRIDDRWLLDGVPDPLSFCR